MLEQRGSANGDEKVMIIGAGNAGRMLIRELIMSSHLHTKACCIIDDNPAKLGRFIDGVPIVGNRNDIPEMVEKYDITKIEYAVPSTSGKDRKDILLSLIHIYVIIIHSLREIICSIVCCITKMVHFRMAESEFRCLMDV